MNEQENKIEAGTSRRDLLKSATRVGALLAVLGGVGTLFGPLVGTIAYTALRDVLSKFIGNWELFVGFTLLFIMLAGEKGLWGSAAPWLEKKQHENPSVGAALLILASRRQENQDIPTSEIERVLSPLRAKLANAPADQLSALSAALRVL